ncbi:MAG: hypothetical protein AB1921_20340 [Thermodesulfobacteriota bacterium]
MARFPVFQSPFLDAAEKRMGSCENKVHCYMGDDTRPLSRILAEDEAEVNALGLTHEAIGHRLFHLAEQAKKGLGSPVVVEDRFLVAVEAARGKLSCPFGHPGLFAKTHVVLVNQKTGESLVWSDLSMHLIAEHGFYQGKGSPYRLSPKKIAAVLGLSRASH